MCDGNNEIRFLERKIFRKEEFCERKEKCYTKTEENMLRARVEGREGEKEEGKKMGGWRLRMKEKERRRLRDGRKVGERN